MGNMFGGGGGGGGGGGWINMPPMPAPPDPPPPAPVLPDDLRTPPNLTVPQTPAAPPPPPPMPVPDPLAQRQAAIRKLAEARSKVTTRASTIIGSDDPLGG